MDSSEQRRKRKQLQQLQTKRALFPLRNLFLVICPTCLVFLFYISSDRFSITTASSSSSSSSSSKLRTAVVFSDVSLLTSSSSSFTESINHSNDDDEFRMLKVEDRVLFPDHVLLLLRSNTTNYQSEEMECVYSPVAEGFEVVTKPVLSTDVFNVVRLIVRCPIPLMNYSVFVELRVKEAMEDDRGRVSAAENEDDSRSVHSWDMVAYEAVLDGDTAVVFVKGLNLRPDRVSDSTHISCHFELENLGRNESYATKAISAAQEVVRCALPRSVKHSLDKAQRVRVAIGFDQVYHSRIVNHTILPSVASISGPEVKIEQLKVNTKYEMCVCTMVWNQASSLREWIVYHSWLGVERWFIYDNNSDDEIKDVISELEEDQYRVTRHTWPWIKTQEAGFSHCAIRAKNECNWVGFFDVDEFFYFPVHTHQGLKESSVAEENALHNLVTNYSASGTIGELRTACHSFGPSGLRKPPQQGVTTGYTCRLQSPERHKSIVRLDALHNSLLNVVHHFHLKEGFQYTNIMQSMSLINHYKYQVWDVFKAKFYRRVATYVADWQENQNEGSKDRAPGLGTEAIEPSDWHLRFCEVWDTGLSDTVLANLVDPTSGKLPWERADTGIV